MPVGRVLLKSISQGARPAYLKTDGARLLFSWLNSWVEYTGCYHGDAKMINRLVLTRLGKSDRLVEAYLTDLEANDLVIRYQVGRERYLCIPDMAEKQPNLRPEKEAKAMFPLPPADLLAAWRERRAKAKAAQAGVTPDQGRSKAGVGPSQDRLNLNLNFNLNLNTMSLAAVETELIAMADVANLGNKFEQMDIDLTLLLVLLIFQNNPISRVVAHLTPHILEAWINECRLLRTRDAIPDDVIARVIRFSQYDRFWSTVVLSMPKFREKFDQLLAKAQLRAKQEAGFQVGRSGLASQQNFLVEKWGAKYEELKKRYMTEKSMTDENQIDPFEFPSFSGFAQEMERRSRGK